MKLLTHFNGPFVFLEEDHYVTPDLLHFLHLMLQFKEE